MKTDAVLTAALACLAVLAALVLLRVLAARRFRAGGSGGAAKPVCLELGWLLLPLLAINAMIIAGRLAREAKASPVAVDKGALRLSCGPAGWTVAYPDGKTAAGTIRVPMARPVTFLVAGRAEIQAFTVPALRVGARVPPGRDTAVPLVFPSAGLYDVLCSEPGLDFLPQRVLALAPEAYDRWKMGKTPETAAQGDPFSAAGDALMAKGDVLNDMGCRACHSLTSAALAPRLEDIWGQRVRLQGGGEITVDEAYVRESLNNPGAKVVHGYQAIMPSYAGRLSRADLGALIAYMKSSTAKDGRAAATPPKPAAAAVVLNDAVLNRFACRTCHVPRSRTTAPLLEGLWGSRVALEDGREVVADEAYVRESVLRPGDKLVAGYAAIMPSYEGRLSEEDMAAVLAYLRAAAR